MTYLTPDEILSILKVANKKSLRDWLLILVAYKHGLRASEVTKIKITDLKDGCLSVKRAKGSRHTVQPLLPHRGEPLLDEVRGIKQWLRERPTDSGNFLFPSALGGALHRSSFFRIFETHAAAAGIDEGRRHPHVLKHSAANTLIRNGAEISHVQQYLGHKSINSTLQYVKISDQEASQKAQTALMEAFN